MWLPVLLAAFGLSDVAAPDREAAVASAMPAARSASSFASSGPGSPAAGTTPSNFDSANLTMRLTKLPSTSARSLLVVDWNCSQVKAASDPSGP